MDSTTDSLVSQSTTMIPKAACSSAISAAFMVPACTTMYPATSIEARMAIVCSFASPIKRIVFCGCCGLFMVTSLNQALISCCTACLIASAWFPYPKDVPVGCLKPTVTTLVSVSSGLLFMVFCMTDSSTPVEVGLRRIRFGLIAERSSYPRVCARQKNCNYTRR